MDEILEFLIDIVLEGSIEGAKSKKVPMFLRVILCIIVVVIFSIVLFLFFALGIKSLETSILMGLFLIGIGLMLLIVGLRKCVLFLKEREGQEDDFNI